MAGRLRQDAVIRKLEIIGEGAGETLLGNRRVLVQKGRAPALKGRKRRIPLSVVIAST